MSEDWSAPDPIARFVAALEEARRIPRSVLPEPTAFALATVDPDGQPAVRMVLLKAADDHGFVFYTNFQSRKGHDLFATPRAGMCFHWQPIEVQIRVEGGVEPVSDAEADAYFASRARGSQIGAWASRQSEVLDRPETLAARVAQYEAQFAGRSVPRPPYWSGFRLIPRTIEFWKGMPSRLHWRQRYVREQGDWRVEWLNP